MKISAFYDLFLSSTGVSTDSRTVSSGNLFFALKGPQFNGNAYATEALKKNAKFAVVDDPKLAKRDPRFILVDNGLKTLQTLANFHRKQLKTTIIGLTGSNGKTTTKELFKRVLSKKHTVLATQGNLNNHIGVPLTLLQLKKNTEIGVVEMGASRLGEIKLLCEIAQPDWGYITNFGRAHLEGFGDEEGVIKAKSELYEFVLKNNAKLLVNGDDPIQMKRSTNHSKITFGSNAKSNYCITLDGSEHEMSFVLNNFRFSSALYGMYNASNIAAAIAIGKIFNVNDSDIQEAIASYKPDNNRSQKIDKGDYSIILDAYNANPSSMETSLDSFLKGVGDQSVVLGDMLELGVYAEREHQTIVDKCSKTALKAIVLVGEIFHKTKSCDPRIIKFKTTEDLISYLETNKIQGRNLLIKGSRSMALEKILKYL